LHRGKLTAIDRVQHGEILPIIRPRIGVARIIRSYTIIAQIDAGPII
jgi:hypothetical protein